MKTTSLRKSLTYLESVSARRDVVIILRVEDRVSGQGLTFHCTPEQALNHLFLKSSNKFRWMIVS